MKNNEKHNHDPKFQIMKRVEMKWYKSWTVRIVAILLALVICAFVIVLLTGYNPMEVYAAMIKGTFGTKRKMWSTMQKLAMLLCISRRNHTSCAEIIIIPYYSIIINIRIFCKEITDTDTSKNFPIAVLK